jgi:undecaprenyl-diphosphatase
MNTVFIFGARYLFLLVPLIALVFFLKQSRSKQKEMAIFSVISIVLIYLLAVLAGHVYFNPRPFVVGNFTPLIPHSADNGFPSDHVLFVSAIASVIMYFNRRISLVLWGLTIIVATSRVYVGVHHFVDVLASMIISLLVTALVYTSMKNVTHKKVS